MPKKKTKNKGKTKSPEKAEIKKEIPSRDDKGKKESITKEKKDIQEKKQAPADKEKKKKENIIHGIIISVLIIAILVAAYLPFRIYSPEYDFPVEVPEQPDETAYTYHGYNFEKSAYGWRTRLSLEDRLYEIDFWYGPKSVEQIPVEAGINNLILGAEKIYITNHPFYSAETVKAQVEIAKITSPRTDFATGMLNIPTMMTTTFFPEGREQPGLVPADCFNASDEVSVVKLVLGDTTAVYKEGLCVIVEGVNETELIKAANRLSYNLLGIIKKPAN
ncbi:MAG TPA: hypothetical protein ENN46_04240 [Candidatus Woesearchaeota archaeon]|nr:hypothetical protein [Candidatus Woesearchaeota archaeon]